MICLICLIRANQKTNFIQSSNPEVEVHLYLKLMCKQENQKEATSGQYEYLTTGLVVTFVLSSTHSISNSNGQWFGQLKSCIITLNISQ